MHQLNYPMSKTYGVSPLNFYKMIDKQLVNLVNKFKEYIKNTPPSEVMEPYSVEVEYGDTYIKHDDIEDYYLSINDKGLVALHDENDKEIWHLEKDIADCFGLANRMVGLFIQAYLFSILPPDFPR